MGRAALHSDELSLRPAAHAPPSASNAASTGRVRVAGKLFALDTERWYVKGLTYGPFAPNNEGHFLPERPQLRRDFEHLSQLGVNAIRLYHVPPVSLLDDALRSGLRVLIDVPWEKHRCFFEDWSTTLDAM